MRDVKIGTTGTGLTAGDFGWFLIPRQPNEEEMIRRVYQSPSERKNMWRRIAVGSIDHEGVRIEGVQEFRLSAMSGDGVCEAEIREVWGGVVTVRAVRKVQGFQ